MWVGRGRRVRSIGREWRRVDCEHGILRNIEPMQAEPLIVWSDPVRELVGFIGTFLVAGAIGFRYSAARHQSTGTEASFYIVGLQRAAKLGILGAIIGLGVVFMGIPDTAAKPLLSN